MPPKSRHGTQSVSEARGTKTFSRIRPTGAHPALLAPLDGQRVSFFVINRADTPVYIGGSDVTVDTGIPLESGVEFEDKESYDAWYAITDNVRGDVIVVTTEVAG